MAEGAHPKQNWIDAFNLIDREKCGTIPSARLGELLRAVGQYPTESFIESLSHSDPVSLTEFLGIAVPTPVMSLADAFSSFDPKRTGRLSVGQLLYILLGTGEPLPVPLADEICALAKRKCLTESGEIKISLLLAELQLMNEPPKPYNLVKFR